MRRCPERNGVLRRWGPEESGVQRAGHPEEKNVPEESGFLKGGKEVMRGTRALKVMDCCEGEIPEGEFPEVGGFRGVQVML